MLPWAYMHSDAITGIVITPCLSCYCVGTQKNSHACIDCDRRHGHMQTRSVLQKEILVLYYCVAANNSANSYFRSSVVKKQYFLTNVVIVLIIIIADYNIFYGK